MKYILSVLVENKPGVLSRVTGLISRRGFNIDSLTVAPTEDLTMSRMTIIVDADEVAYEQLTKQLHKLVSVYKISDLTDTDAIERELVLFKVIAPPDRRHEIIEIANIFRANIVDVGKNSLTVEATGTAKQARRHGGPVPQLRDPPAHAHRQDRHEPQGERPLARAPGAVRGRLGLWGLSGTGSFWTFGDGVILPCPTERRRHGAHRKMGKADPVKIPKSRARLPYQVTPATIN